MTYNLLREPWIPVLRHDGMFLRLGIIDALSQAHLIREIASSNPMDRVAIFRLLLSILYWCKGNPTPKLQDASASAFPPDWFSRLDEHSDWFNLLGDGTRFYQHRVSGSPVPNPSPLPSTYLAEEVPTGTNIAHFCHSRDYNDGLCCACCAKGLVRLPAFATQGGKGKSPGINQAPPLYQLPERHSLAHSLRASWKAWPTLGTPAWVQPDITPPSKGEVPLLVGLTWLPRAVWLSDPDEPEATCIACGRTERLIRTCVFAGLGSRKAQSPTPGAAWADPHVIYVQSGKSGKAALRAADVLDSFSSAFADWARLAQALLADAGPDERRARVVGFSTGQAKYREATEWLLPMPSTTAQRVEHREYVLQWWKEGSRLWAEVLPPARPRWKKGRPVKYYKATFAQVRPHLEYAAFAGLGSPGFGEIWWKQVEGSCTPMMIAIAGALYPEPTAASLRERMRIESIRPKPPKQQAEAKDTSRNDTH